MRKIKSAIRVRKCVRYVYLLLLRAIVVLAITIQISFNFQEGTVALSEGDNISLILHHCQLNIMDNDDEGADDFYLEYKVSRYSNIFAD